MTAIACCGHEVFGDDAFKGYFWKQWGSGSEPELCHGNLCLVCVPVYQAVEAESWEEAEELLVKEPVDLIDILSGQTGIKPRVENIEGIDFRILELPGKINNSKIKGE